MTITHNGSRTVYDNADKVHSTKNLFPFRKATVVELDHGANPRIELYENDKRVGTARTGGMKGAAKIAVAWVTGDPS